jgi:hypothetical protein
MVMTKTDDNKAIKLNPMRLVDKLYFSAGAATGCLEESGNKPLLIVWS